MEDLHQSPIEGDSRNFRWLSEWLLRVESAISDFSGADAQIRSADYLYVKSPLTGVAEVQSPELLSRMSPLWREAVNRHLNAMWPEWVERRPTKTLQRGAIERVEHPDQRIDEFLHHTRLTDRRQEWAGLGNRGQETVTEKLL